MNELNLSAPWHIFYNEMTKLFEKDKEVKLEFDDDNYEIKLYVDGVDKADALTRLLPEEKKFGNVTVKITVIPANKEEMTYEDLYRTAFKNNPVVSYITRGSEYVTSNETYVVFVDDVVQYYNDDIGDVNRIKSTLYQDIASNIFDNKTGIHYCTELTDPFVVPNGKYRSSNGRHFKF